MKKGINYLLIFILVVSSCKSKPLNETMQKFPYTGDELRIGGYYYSELSSENNIGTAIFYRDGVCFHFFSKPLTEDTLNYIENEFILNESFITNIKEDQRYLGVFNIDTNSLEFETWEISRFGHQCEIINDTTFILKKRINIEAQISFDEELEYKFKSFNPKPDSLNNFIE